MKKISKEKKILKEASVLLVATILFFTSTSILGLSIQMNEKANTPIIWISTAKTDDESNSILEKVGDLYFRQKILKMAGVKSLEPDVPPLPLQVTNWIHYDDGVNSNSIGLTSGGTFEEAIYLTSTELGLYSSCWLSEVKVYQGHAGESEPSHTINIKIYGPNTPTTPGAPIRSQTETTASGVGFQTFVLTSPVDLSLYAELWVSIEWLNTLPGEYPAGVDAGPAVDGKGDWLGISGSWVESQSYGLDYNNMIYAGIECAINSPPYPPNTPNPIDGAIGVNPCNDLLSWYCPGDPDSDPVRYDVYFGYTSTTLTPVYSVTVPPSSLPCTQTLSLSSVGIVLVSGTQYFWRVDATDIPFGHTTSSGIFPWSFTTSTTPITATVSIVGGNIIRVTLTNSGSTTISGISVEMKFTVTAPCGFPCVTPDLTGNGLITVIPNVEYKKTFSSFSLSGYSIIFKQLLNVGGHACFELTVTIDNCGAANPFRIQQITHGCVCALTLC